MLNFNKVSRIFEDGTRAVDEVSLHIKKGEFCVLLGPSGAGKSTLMGMVNGLVIPTAGFIRFNGKKLSKSNIKGFQSRVGTIHQQLHLVPRLSVLHNVLAGTLHHLSNVRSLFKLFDQNLQRKACRLLEEVELEEKHIYRRASALSGGQQQRVAIARALMSYPDVVLADEPVASLDPNTSHGVLNLLKKLASMKNSTVLCSLHQVEYAIQFADRIIGLRQGKLIYDGAPEGLSDQILERLYGNKGETQWNTPAIDQSIAGVSSALTV